MTEVQEQPKQQVRPMVPLMEPAYELHRDELTAPVRRYADSLHAQLGNICRRYEIEGEEMIRKLQDLVSGRKIPLEEIKQLQEIMHKLHQVVETGKIPKEKVDSEEIRIDWEDYKELKVLEGHRDTVTAITVSSDGRIISGSNDATIRTWNSKIGASTKKIEAHVDEDGILQPVEAIIFTSDDNIISAGGDGTIRIWDSKTGEEIKKIEVRDHVKKGEMYAFGDNIVYRDGDSVFLLNPKTGKKLKKLEIPRHRPITFTSDGKVISGYDKTIRVWDLETGKILEELEGHTHGITKLASLPDSKLISAGLDDIARIWDLETGEEVNKIRLHRNLKALAVAPDGKIISGGGVNEEIHVWDPETGKEIKRLIAPSLNVVYVSHDGKIITGGWDRKIRIFGPKND